MDKRQITALLKLEDPIFLDMVGPAIFEVRYYMVRAISLSVGGWGVDSEGVLLDPLCSP